jgi:hypothetical protein
MKLYSICIVESFPEDNLHINNTKENDGNYRFIKRKRFKVEVLINFIMSILFFDFQNVLPVVQKG